MHDGIDPAGCVDPDGLTPVDAGVRVKRTSCRQSAYDRMMIRLMSPRVTDPPTSTFFLESKYSSTVNMSAVVQVHRGAVEC
jgi:hypothetical protein